MQNKDAKLGLGGVVAARALARSLDILLQLLDGVLERGARVVDLVDNEDVFANQVCHFQRGQVQPLCAGYDGPGGFDVGVRGIRGGGGGELFVEGEADGLDGDVGRAFALEEGSVGGVL